MMPCKGYTRIRILLGGRLGSGADEGRDKRRYSLASGMYTLNQGSLNGTSH
jgi:hypothetical protein